MKPIVSVLICTYNAEQFIEGTLESILAQTEKNIEVLILDNNSTDKTTKIIETIKDPRIQVFASKKNLGPYGGLNFLLPKAQGKYIAIQDHDDFWDSTKLEKQITFLETHTEDIWCGTTSRMMFRYNNTYFDYVFPKKSFYVIHPSLLFRNRPWLAYDTKELYMGDAYFMKHILCKWEKKLGTINEVLTTHIIQANYSNASFSRFKTNKSCIRRLFAIHWWRPYTFAALGFELMRKLLYPTLKKHHKFGTIVKLEQLPFKLLGFKIKH